MSEKLKKYLGLSIIIAVLSLAITLPGYLYYYSKSANPAGYKSFAVTADGKAIGIPDTAEFTLSVITEGGLDIINLQNQNTAKMNKIIQYAKSNGIESKDIKTKNYSLTPRYQDSRCGDNPCPPPQIVGYSIYQTVSVKTKNFDKINIILSGAVANGANSVSTPAFKIDDPTNVENEARAQAIVKAKEKALKIAEAGGFRLGQLLSIDEYQAYPYMMEGKGGGMSATVAAPMVAAPPTIEPGSQEVSVNVTLRYEID